MKITEEIKKDNNKYTRFYDMSSGGRQKLQWSIVYVNLPETEAIQWFENKFGRNPYNVTCTCCGEDYSISSAETLEELTEFQRNQVIKNLASQKNPKISYEEYKNITDCIPLSEYLEMPNILYVEITDENT